MSEKVSVTAHMWKRREHVSFQKQPIALNRTQHVCQVMCHLCPLRGWWLYIYCTQVKFKPNEASSRIDSESDLTNQNGRTKGQIRPPSCWLPEEIERKPGLSHIPGSRCGCRSRIHICFSVEVSGPRPHRLTISPVFLSCDSDDDLLKKKWLFPCFSCRLMPPKKSDQRLQADSSILLYLLGTYRHHKTM